MVRSSAYAPKFDKKTPEEGQRTHQPKHCEYNNKDEVDSPKTLNDKKTDKNLDHLFIYTISYLLQNNFSF